MKTWTLLEYNRCHKRFYLKTLQNINLIIKLDHVDPAIAELEGIPPEDIYRVCDASYPCNAFGTFPRGNCVTMVNPEEMCWTCFNITVVIVTGREDEFDNTKTYISQVLAPHWYFAEFMTQTYKLCHLIKIPEYMGMSFDIVCLLLSYKKVCSDCLKFLFKDETIVQLPIMYPPIG